MKSLDWVGWVTPAAVVAASAAGCGGNVVADGVNGGDGGAGGAGSTTTTSTDTVTSTSTTTNTSSTVTGPGTVCEAVCAKGAQLGCGQPGTCVSDCESTFSQVKQCTGELAAYYQCIVDNATNCDTTPACNDEQDALSLCLQGGSCGPAECGGTGSGGMTECFCNQQCTGYSIEVDCKSNGGTSSCQCLMNGSVVGSCSENPSSFCDPQGGCCAVFFP